MILPATWKTKSRWALPATWGVWPVPGKRDEDFVCLARPTKSRRIVICQQDFAEGKSWKWWKLPSIQLPLSLFFLCRWSWEDVTTSKQLPVVQYSNTQFSLWHKAHWKMEVFWSQMFSPHTTFSWFYLVFRGAHGLVLSARSSFFAAALGLPSFVERGRRQVHLGIVEARYVTYWRAGKLEILRIPNGCIEEDHCHKVWWFDGCRSRISAFGILAKIPVLLKGPSEVYCVTSTPGAARLKPVPQWWVARWNCTKQDLIRYACEQIKVAYLGMNRREIRVGHTSCHAMFFCLILVSRHLASSIV